MHLKTDKREINMKLFLTICCTFVFFTGILLHAGKNEPEDTSVKKTLYELKSELNFDVNHSPPFIDFDDRKTKAVLYSVFVPGSGQYTLGHYLKGTAITLAFFGTGLTAVIAHNNFTGSEDRLKVLTEEYKASGGFAQAERAWQSIQTEKLKRDNDYKRRQMFTYAAIGVWVYNIIDVIFFSEERSRDIFATSQQNNSPEINFVVSDFSGIELKFNLP